MEIIWSRQARKSANKIFHNIAEDSVFYAEMVRNRLMYRIESLKVTPFIGKPSGVNLVRELVLVDYPYSVFYLLDEECEIIYIVDVSHQSQVNVYRPN